MEDRSKIKE